MKRKMATKVLSCLLAATMMVGITACGTSEKNETAEDDKTVEDDKTADGTDTPEKDAETEAEKTWTDDDLAEITIMMAGANTPDDENIVLDALEAATGTKIKMIYVSDGDYDTKLNTMIGGGDIPDIFWCGDLSFVQELKDAGLIVDVTDVLNAVAPNVIEETKDVIHKPSVNSDGIYMVMNTKQSWGVNVNIRADWLENLGLEMPTNLEEFAQIMHAFTYDDPDGNGIDDTFGYSFSLSTMVGEGRTGQNLFGAFGIPKGHNIELEDGSVTSWVKHPHFLEAVKYIKSLIDDGVCEPDYVSIPNTNMFEKIWNGTSGCIEWECVGPTNNWMPGRYVEQDPLPEFDFAVLEGPYGDYGTSASNVICTEGWVFSAACENLEGAAKIANFCMSEDGSDLLVLGVEDVMYKWVDKDAGEVEYLEPYNDDATHRAAGGFCYTTLFQPKNFATYRTLNEQTREGVELAWSVGIEYADILSTSEVYVECGADMDQIINEMFAELLTTDEDKMQEVYDDYIAQWEAAGGSDWEQEVTELWKQKQEN